LVTERRSARIAEVLSRRQPTLTILVEAVSKPHNVAAILRSCDAVAVGTLHLIAPTPLALSAAVSASAARWVETVRWDSAQVALAALKQRGFQLVATHLGAQSQDFRALDYCRPTCFLLGAERWGLSEAALALADHNVQIPMLGMVPSLNLSVAAALLLFEAQRQRAAAGLYATQQLEEAEFQRLSRLWRSQES
jgi:tRNA (guanosine-2'-O-)-methyltransferase